MNSIIQEFTKILSKEQILTDIASKKPFESEWRNRYSNKCLAVLFPDSVEQIAALLEICNIHKVGVVPQGGNTSMCGGSIPIDSEILQVIINLKLLNKIIAIDAVNSSITVEAGCTLLGVAEAAKTHGLYFPLSIGAEGTCQIGGNIATNAGGIHVIKYGMMRDLVLGIEAVLADGRSVNQLHSLRKNNTYFDLKQLFIGSEGTLGVITKATLKLFPQPPRYFTVMCGVDNLIIACNLLRALSAQFSLCAFEIINKLTQHIYNRHFNQNRLAISAPWIILFEIETGTDFDPANLTDLLIEQQLNLNLCLLASNESERHTLWQIRENIPLAEKMEGIAVKHDISLPISNIEDFIQTNQENIFQHYPDAQIIIFGHLGDGNLHYNIQFKTRSIEELKSIEKDINALVYADVYKYAGSFSAEHGIGFLKKNWMSKYYDPVSYNLALSIKKLVDPNNLLNPGKVF